jgi:hypothetical protein
LPGDLNILLETTFFLLLALLFVLAVLLTGGTLVPVADLVSKTVYWL